MTKKINPELWTDIEDYLGQTDDQHAGHEFSQSATELPDLQAMTQVNRRRFLSLMAASSAFAATSCKDYQEKGKLLTYTNRPEEVQPGVANHYASTCQSCPSSCGTLIKTREGRPIKIEGNPDHPVNEGKLCTRGQANIMGLYDPSRLAHPVRIESGSAKKISWAEADIAVHNALKMCSRDKKEIAIVTQGTTSPSTTSLLREFVKRNPTARVYSYDLFNDATRQGAFVTCYGRNFPVLDWKKVDVLVALESDLLTADPDRQVFLRAWSLRRNITETASFNRVYAVEGQFSDLGMNADYRLKLRPDQQYKFVLSLLNNLVVQKRVPSNFRHYPDLFARIKDYSVADFAQESGIDAKVLLMLINDLLKHQGRSLIYAGRSLTEEVHIAVNFLNDLLGNTAVYQQNEKRVVPRYSSKSDLEQLIGNMKFGKVGAVIHFDANPVYHLPLDYMYRDGLKNVTVSVTLTEAMNESGMEGQYVLPIHHNLESWSDAQVRDHVYSLVQPVIQPLLDTRQKEGIVLHWMKGFSGGYLEDSWYDYLQTYWRQHIFSQAGSLGGFANFWQRSIHDGIALLPEKKYRLPPFQVLALTKLNAPDPDSLGYLVSLFPSYTLGDGKFAGNGWLQELPHNVYKVTWDNVAAMSQNTAKKIGVWSMDMLAVTVGANKVELPVFIQPGMADGMIAMEMGYGRKVAGPVGTGVGVDVGPLTSKHDRSKLTLIASSVKPVGRKYPVVTSQEQNHITQNPMLKDLHLIRKIIQSGTVKQYQADPAFLKHGHHAIFDVTKSREYPGTKWGMSINLNKCIGCADCTTSCNVENNIPVVGKDQVAVGREMSWMRIDRYYSGTVDEPQAAVQPMLCQHCDNAPCEVVCPVSATTHSKDGLNDIAYNRCVGTRYCANNCAYKVRRFNYFNFRNWFADGHYEEPVAGLASNPEVTVRSRGVVEKCTFCVQRIMETRAAATRAGKPLDGSMVKTACQESCPTDAIVFGDVNQVDSLASHFRNHELGYHVLEELNVRPNVTYLAKLRNTHPEDQA